MDNPDARKKSSSSARNGHAENDASDKTPGQEDGELASTVVTNLSQILAEMAERNEKRQQQETQQANQDQNQTLVTNLSQVLAERSEQRAVTQREAPRTEPLPSPALMTESAAPVPQQATSAVGWEAAPTSAPPTRRSRPVVILLGLALVGAIGGAAVGFRMSQPPASPVPAAAVSTESTAMQILNEIESDLQARRWTDAINKSSHLLRTPEVSSAIKDAAQAKQTRATQEARAQEVYEGFLAAAGSGDNEKALALYQKIPNGSVFRSMAKERYDQILSIPKPEAEAARPRPETTPEAPSQPSLAQPPPAQPSN